MMSYSYIKCYSRTRDNWFFRIPNCLSSQCFCIAVKSVSNASVFLLRAFIDSVPPLKCSQQSARKRELHIYLGEKECYWINFRRSGKEA